MSNLKEWSLDTMEVGKSVGINKGSTFKVYIAKVLPLVPFGKPKVKPVVISKTCFANATACKPSVATKVKTRNYIEIPVSKTSSINKSTIKGTKTGVKTTAAKPIKHGAKLRIDIQNKNVNKMYVASKAEKVMK